MTKYFRFLLYLLLASGVSFAWAGSYEDFFRAIVQDNPREVRGLLERGFDPNALDPSGRPGLFIALQRGSLQAAEVLADWPRTNIEWRSPKDESALMMASLKGDTELARKLIARGADVNKTGWAPLHYAATGGHVQIIQMLLDESAYIDAESPNKTTPLMMAAYYGTPEAVKLLLEAGADATLRNQQGLSAFDFAERGHRKEAAELISAAIRSKQPKGKW